MKNYGQDGQSHCISKAKRAGSREASPGGGCCLTQITSTLGGRQPPIHHLGHDRQHFPRNWRNFTRNIAAGTPLPQSSHFSSWRFLCFWAQVCTVPSPGMLTCSRRGSCPPARPSDMGLPRLDAGQSHSRCKCFPGIGFLRKRLEGEVLSPCTEVGAAALLAASSVSWHALPAPSVSSKC